MNDAQNSVMRAMEAYCANIEAGYKERWAKFPVELYNSEIYETIGGLMARQVTLSQNLAMCPPIWNGHVAPLILRSMIDAHITLAWILKEPNERSKKYVLYGLGQAKLLLEHYKAHANNKDEVIKQTIEAYDFFLNSQKAHWAVNVNVGTWTDGPSVRDMAIECDCEDLYKFAYTPFSAVVHNTWQHICAYNLKPCTNPLHKFHKIPDIIEVSIEIDYVYRSVVYVEKSYKIIDEFFQLSIETVMPLDFWEAKMEELSTPVTTS